MLRVLLAFLLPLSALAAAPRVEVDPRPVPEELTTARAGYRYRGSPKLLQAYEPYVVYRGGAEPRRLGPGRVRWVAGRFELAFAREQGSKRAWFLLLDDEAAAWAPVARIPTPPGGEPRAYLSDRDALVAFTVDHGTWDTCPEVRWLKADGKVEPLPLPCPDAGRAAAAALEAAGVGKVRQEGLRLRLTNIRWVEPGFFSEGGAHLDAELRTGGETYPARFLLRHGKIEQCRLLPR